MKKELLAVALLVILLITSLINSAAISGICRDIDAIILEAGSEADSGDWEGARKRVDDAVSLWRSREKYTRIVLRHTDIETLTDDFYELTEHIYTQDPGAVKSAVALVTEHLKGISEMESINFGSIF